jgi:hypothetical protein
LVPAPDGEAAGSIYPAASAAEAAAATAPEGPEAADAGTDDDTVVPLRSRLAQKVVAGRQSLAPGAAAGRAAASKARSRLANQHACPWLSAGFQADAR